MENNLTISSLSLADLEKLYRQNDNSLNWNLVFTLPAWLKVWWENFGAGAELFIRSVQDSDRVIGIAPLLVRGQTTAFIGNTDVCDYQDFVLVPGREILFFNNLLDDLLRQGITEMHLETVRPDSSVVNFLLPIAQSRGYVIEYRQSDVSSVLNLPATWEEYLSSLDGKQRHEIKRKFRNLNNLGRVSYRAVSQKIEMPQIIETFLKLFPESRGDKARFMTSAMQNYFRELALALVDVGVVGFGVLDFESRPVAMVMYFDYNDGIYLYNSAFDPAYRSSSVGIISKVSSIHDCIDRQKKLFDFMKGPEVYKSYLGGQTIPLYSCHINLKQ